MSLIVINNLRTFCITETAKREQQHIIGQSRNSNWTAGTLRGRLPYKILTRLEMLSQENVKLRETLSVTKCIITWAFL